MKTKWGVKKEYLVLHKNHLMTTSELATYRRKFVCNGLLRWNAATLLARKALKLKGFVPMLHDTPLYKKAVCLYNNAAFGVEDIMDVFDADHPCIDACGDDILEAVEYAQQ